MSLFSPSLGFANSDICVLIPKYIAIYELENVLRISTPDTNAKITTSECVEHVKFRVEAGQKNVVVYHSLVSRTAARQGTDDAMRIDIRLGYVSMARRVRSDDYSSATYTKQRLNAGEGGNPFPQLLVDMMIRG